MTKRNLRKLIGASLMAVGIATIYLVSIKSIPGGLVVLVCFLFVVGAMLFVS